MEWLNELAQYLIGQYPVLSMVFTGLGLLLVVAQVIVPFTSTERDDEILKDIKSNSFLKTLWDFFLSFAPIQKKKDGIKLSRKE